MEALIPAILKAGAEHGPLLVVIILLMRANSAKDTVIKDLSQACIESLRVAQATMVLTKKEEE